MGKIDGKKPFWIIVCALFLAACSSLTSFPAPTSTPFLPPGNNPPTPTINAVTPSNVQVWFDPGTPTELKSQVHLPFPFVEAISQADSQLSIAPNQESSDKSLWIYALVAAFPTVQDDMAWQDLAIIWKGSANPQGTFIKILVSKTTFYAMENILGVPGENATEIVPDDKLVDRLWEERNSLGIVPFEDLMPRMKVLSIDSNSPIHKTFDKDSYPLEAAFGITGDPSLLDSLLPAVPDIMPSSNWDPNKMTIITMTGTTALVRALAYRMETKGILYPGEKVKDVLSQGDFLDVSNEVSFYEYCPYPNPYSNSLQFCSKPEYIQLFDDLGVNIVELTGNHMLDFDAKPFYYTLDLYTQRGWGTFGGGRDAQSARQPLLREHNGNKIAWIGCNTVGPELDWATDYRPGAAKCDFAYMTSQIQQLKSEGYLVISSIQDQELYSPYPEDYIRNHFLTLAAAGADIVQGSQAHFPQVFEFYQSGNTLIHFGLGNMFFDQMDVVFPGIQREFIDRHILYNGRYISTELITTMLEDYSQPRLMTKEERESFLQEYFNYSGW